MPWYQALLILGSVAALSITIVFRPSSGARPMAFTLLIGALILASFGLAVHQVVEAAYIAAWLSAS